MTPVQAAILGLVEGITEYLPISSTGHLIIAEALLGLNEPEETKRNVDAFLVVIQGGAILAVLGLYRARVMQMIRGLLGRDRAGLRLFLNLIIAFLPAAILGVLLAEHIERLLFHPRPVLIALAAGGVLMLVVDRWQKRMFHDDPPGGPTLRVGTHDAERRATTYIDIEHLTWRRALLIGLLQCVAMIPGTSRSMMTIVGGMLVGLRPRQAAEFSFLLGLPTLGGACLYKAVQNFRGDGQNMVQSLGWGAVVIGLVTATISAALAVHWLVGFLTRHGLALFGWYRLGLCAVFLVLMAAGVRLFPV